MYFSRARLLRHSGGMDLYQEHKLIWNLFDSDENASRDFLYRRTGRLGVAEFYLLSRREPEASHEWSVETKPYAPKVVAGASFSFSLRVNPVIRKRDENGKQKRDDIIMETRHKQKSESGKLPETGAIVEKAGRKWLLERSEKLGFSVPERSLIIDDYFKLTSRQSRSGRQLHFGVLDYSGVLEITEPPLFLQSLYSGIGPAKAFGCGLLLIRPL